MNTNTITIIGLGLIGGSIAKALKQRFAINNIIAIDSNEETLNQALEEGVISLAYTDITPDIAMSDIIFLCTPVNQTLKWVKNIIPFIKPSCIITDTASTKLEMINEIEEIDGLFRFVGGHPMAGSEKSGYPASKSHLFENAYYIFTPCSKSTKQDIQLLSSLVTCMGCIPVEMSPELHDKTTGAISHVPHIISATLVNMVRCIDGTENYMQKLAAGGFRDITRISSSSPHMWSDICLSNKKSIIETLKVYIKMLIQFKQHLQCENEKEIYEFLNSAKEFRSLITSKATGLIPGTYELILDVIDEPGIIGKVATILGANNINIKNINVNNSREFEQGVLIISLPDIQSMDKACKILSNHGYNTLIKK